jgi:hypothetical protein
MMQAAAELLRAADGAGLPSRAARVIEQHDVREEDDEGDAEEGASTSSSPSFDFVNTLVAQVVPMLLSSMSGKKMPKLAAVLDWRKAQPATESTADTDAAETDSKQEPPTEVPPLDPKMMGHIIAIQAALPPDEAALARQLAAELTPAEQRAWFDELTSLSVPDAVAKVRGLLKSMSKRGVS